MTRPEQEASKGSWAGTAGPTADSPAGSDPYGMAAWLKDISKAPLHPLMQNPAAAMAAATAIGLGMTSHFAGLMFGAMESMTRTAQKTASATDETLAAEAAEPVADVADAAPPTKTETPAKTPVKSKPVKAESAKAAPVKADKPHEQKAAARIVETQADDLKRISGIGPKLEQVLNGMGVRRYADIAAWSDKDVKRFDAQLGFGGRIVRDAWVEQAKTLMKG